ncbi:unnamed protein product [Cuscuta campestris]|uniref:Uncharacterized protein n=1 Tax=Cuscuta campestris TaxID=132261 RepID=A0A484KLP6_9ASTE|nr:unnamed protein product [Cuscuta campestris]
MLHVYRIYSFCDLIFKIRLLGCFVESRLNHGDITLEKNLHCIDCYSVFADKAFFEFNNKSHSFNNPVQKYMYQGVEN